MIGLALVVFTAIFAAGLSTADFWMLVAIGAILVVLAFLAIGLGAMPMSVREHNDDERSLATVIAGLGAVE